MSPTNEKHVVVQDAEHRYLAGNGTEWFFTEDRTKAAVFAYYRDHVAEQVQLANRAYGTAWTITQIDSKDIDEICDHCGGTDRPSAVFFTGNEFLCRACTSPLTALSPMINQGRRTP